jgi:hypothetical protein
MRSRALALLVLGVLAACKSDCERAIEHAVDLTWKQAMASPPGAWLDQVGTLAPSLKERLPAVREAVKQRLGARCGEPAFTRCVLAATDALGIARCEIAPAWP